MAHCAPLLGQKVWQLHVPQWQSDRLRTGLTCTCNYLPCWLQGKQILCFGAKKVEVKKEKEQTFIQAHKCGNSLCSLPMMAVTALVTMAISVSPSMSAGSAPGFCSSCFWSHTHTNHVSVFLFSQNCRPALFSVLCCCLHPPQSLCLLPDCKLCVNLVFYSQHAHVCWCLCVCVCLWVCVCV